MSRMLVVSLHNLIDPRWWAPKFPVGQLVAIYFLQIVLDMEVFYYIIASLIREDVLFLLKCTLTYSQLKLTRTVTG